MLHDLNDTKIPRLAVYASLLCAVVPCGSSVVYVLQRQQFFAVDYGRLILLSAMHSIPVVLAWIVITLACLATGRSLVKGDDELPQFEEGMLNVIILFPTILAIGAMYLSLILMRWLEWPTFQGYLTINGVLTLAFAGVMELLTIAAVVVERRGGKRGRRKKPMPPSPTL